MATKKKGVPASWKKQNYNMNIRVSESTVQQLRKGSMASNIAKANKPGASAEYREAVARFYGKDKLKPVSKIASGTPSGIKPGPKAPSKPTAGKPAGKSAPKKYSSSGTGSMYGSAPKASGNIGNQMAATKTLAKKGYKYQSADEAFKKLSPANQALVIGVQSMVPIGGGVGAVKGTVAAIRLAKTAKNAKAAAALGRTTANALKSAVKTHPDVVKSASNLKKMNDARKKGLITAGELQDARIMLANAERVAANQFKRTLSKHPIANAPDAGKIIVEVAPKVTKKVPGPAVRAARGTLPRVGRAIKKHPIRTAAGTAAAYSLIHNPKEQ